MNAFSEMMNRTGMLLAAVLLAAMVPVAAQAATEAYKKHPGFVDGLPFSEMADPAGELVEVNLTGKLLRLLSSRAIRRHDENLANILGELVSIQAVIADIDPRRAEDARKRVDEIQRKLQEREWERFVRVRESGEEFTAYVHFAGDDDGEDAIDGLVVIGFMDHRELLFVNLVGRIDMERIAVLGERLGVPVLGDIAAIEEDERKKEGQGPGRDKSGDESGDKADGKAEGEAADEHRHAHSLR